MSAFTTAFLTGCRGWRLVRPEVVTKTDSTVIRTEYIERFDTTYLTIVKEVQQAVSDTASTLENEYCISEAEVTPDGKLHHRLETKPQQKPIPTKTIEKSSDTIIYKKVPYPVPYPVEVEKELNWWQRFRLQCFWWVLAALLLALSWIFRKPLKKFILLLFGI